MCQGHKVLSLERGDFRLASLVDGTSQVTQSIVEMSHQERHPPSQRLSLGSGPRLGGSGELLVQGGGLLRFSLIQEQAPLQHHGWNVFGLPR